MDKIKELDKADKEIKEILAKIELVRFHLVGLESNLALLRGIRLQFIQNLAVLKDPNIIPSMAEYKKIADDLQTVNNRIRMLATDFSNQRIALGRTEKLLLDAQEKYAMLWSNRHGKVIRGSFGGKE